MAESDTQGNIVTLDNENVGELVYMPWNAQTKALGVQEDLQGRPRLLTSRGLVPWAYAARLAPLRPSYGNANLFCHVKEGYVGFHESSDNSIIPSPVADFTFGTNWERQTAECIDEQSICRRTSFGTLNVVAWDGVLYDGNLGESAMRSYGALVWDKMADLLSKAKAKCVYPNLYAFAPTRPGETLKTSLSGSSTVALNVWPETSGGSTGKRKLCGIYADITERRPAVLFYMPMLKRKVQFNVSFASNENRTHDWMDAAYREAFRNVVGAFSCKVYVDLFHVRDLDETENTFSPNMRIQLMKSFDFGSASALLSKGQTFGSNVALEYGTNAPLGTHLFLLSPRVEITLPASSVFLANATYDLGDLGEGVEVLRPTGYTGGWSYLPRFTAMVSYDFKATYVGPQ